MKGEKCKVMSNDAGVYILETKGPQYRVAYGHAIENIYGKFNDKTAHYEPNWVSINQYFGKSSIYSSLGAATIAADGISLDYDDLEFGVCLISDFKNYEYQTVEF